jgi:hypothetical protein
MLKSILCIYDGVQIKVVNYITKIRLYVDDQLLDEYHSIIAPIRKTLVLKAVSYPFKSGLKTIQVYNRAIFANKFMICIDGNHVGGDEI